jgi:hypothetical protein
MFLRSSPAQSSMKGMLVKPRTYEQMVRPTDAITSSTTNVHRLKLACPRLVSQSKYQRETRPGIIPISIKRVIPRTLTV